MLVHNVNDIFEKFKVSWGSAGLLTITTPMLDKIFPVLVQICLVFSLQVISIGADYIRAKYNLRERKKSDLDLPGKKADGDPD